MTQGNLKYQFNRLSIAEKLIAINLLVFIVDRLLPFLLGLSSNSIVQWFELPKDFFDFLMQPWSIITYSFFHGGFGVGNQVFKTHSQCGAAKFFELLDFFVVAILAFAKLLLQDGCRRMQCLCWIRQELTCCRCLVEVFTLSHLPAAAVA